MKLAPINKAARLNRVFAVALKNDQKLFSETICSLWEKYSEIKWTLAY